MGIVAARPSQPQPDPGLAWLRLVGLWHALLAAVALAGLVWLWTRPPAGALAFWPRLALSAVLLLAGAASALAVLHIRGHNHAGRTLSLAVNYLGLVAAVLGLLHVTGVFIGLDALADTFGRGLPYLGGVFLGYLVTAAGDRYEDDPQRQRQFVRAGRLIMAVAAAAFLFSVGLVPGLIFWLGQLAQPGPLALLTLGALFGVMLWAMGREPAAAAMQARAHHGEMLNGFLFLSPNLLGFLIFFAGPLLISLYVSFTDWDAFGTRNWVGLANYAEILGLTLQPLATPDQAVREVLDVRRYSELFRFSLAGRSFVLGATDKLFWLSLRNTLLFVLMAVPLSVVPALFLSTLLNSRLPGMPVFRAIYFLPSVAAVVGISLIWQLLYNAAIGYINFSITSLVEGVNALTGLALADPQVRWLSDSRTALLAITVVAAWQTMGFNTVLFLAGLQNIPASLYEAATVDGAGRWAQFRNVTLPLLAPTTFFVVTTTTIQAMQVFEQVFILMNPPEGPNNATLTMVLYLYRSGFQNFKQGYGSAIAWVLFILIFGVTLLQFQRQRRGSAYAD